MRTTASLAAFVTLMAVTSSNGAPIGTPSGSSARSISRARGQLRSRNVPPMPPNFRDADYTVDVPNVKCEDCRKSEVKEVSVDATGPMANMGGDLKDMKSDVFSDDVQVPGVPSGSGIIDIHVDVGDSEDSNNGSPTRPEKHTSDDTTDANNGADDSSDGTTDGTNDGRTDNGQDGKTDPPAEQPPCDNSNDVEDVRDELEEGSKVADDKAHNAMTKAKSESGQAGDGAKAALSSMNEVNGEMKNKAQQMVDNMPDADMAFHAEAKMGAGNHQDDSGKSYKIPGGDQDMSKLVTVSQEPSSENPEDCKDETTVEMREGNPSISTSVVRR